MYKLIYMKADYEPWWKFDGWEDQIVSEESFLTKDECEEALQKKLRIFRERFPNERLKDEYYWAFWTEDECSFCESCDDELQIYHGLIMVFE